MPGLSSTLGPRFQTILASAWISKRTAAKYVQDYVKQIQTQPSTTRSPVAFAPPIQVQVLDIADHSPYESLDAINGGEDSLFHARNKQNLVFGVADGVGGWNDSGIDPSVFSRSLTAYSADSVAKMFLLHESDEVDPKEVMRRAFANMRYDRIPAYGSSTELVANLSLATGKLRTAQLGDSTYVVLDAKQKAKFVSAEQQHRFNMPYQLTIPPTGDGPPPLPKPTDDDADSNAQFFRPQQDIAEDDKAGRDEDSFADLTAVGFDTPNEAREDSHQLAHNDVVVAATDGLFDNVRVEEVEKLAERFMGAIEKITNVTKNVSGRPAEDLFGGLAYSIAAQAVANYIQHDLRSPFAERAKLAGYKYEGGKPDDVTVMIAWVRENARVKAGQAKAKL